MSRIIQWLPLSRFLAGIIVLLSLNSEADTEAVWLSYSCQSTGMTNSACRDMRLLDVSPDNKQILLVAGTPGSFVILRFDESMQAFLLWQTIRQDSPETINDQINTTDIEAMGTPLQGVFSQDGKQGFLATGGQFENPRLINIKLDDNGYWVVDHKSSYQSLLSMTSINHGIPIRLLHVRNLNFDAQGGVVTTPSRLITLMEKNPDLSIGSGINNGTGTEMGSGNYTDPGKNETSYWVPNIFSSKEWGGESDEGGNLLNDIDKAIASRNYVFVSSLHRKHSILMYSRGEGETFLANATRVLNGIVGESNLPPGDIDWNEHYSEIIVLYPDCGIHVINWDDVNGNIMGHNWINDHVKWTNPEEECLESEVCDDGKGIVVNTKNNRVFIWRKAPRWRITDTFDLNTDVEKILSANDTVELSFNLQIDVLKCRGTMENSRLYAVEKNTGELFISARVPGLVSSEPDVSTVTNSMDVTAASGSLRMTANIIVVGLCLVILVAIGTAF